MNQLLSELRRRNVFRVAAAYLVVGWLVMQVVATIGGAAGLPDWADSLALVLLVTGFPIVLFIAWAFELTPDGMKKTDASDGPAGFKPLGPSDYVLIAAVLVVLGVVGFQTLGQSGGEQSVASLESVETNLDEANPSNTPETPVVEAETTDAPVSEASIAVLPFADFSPEGDQQYFSDGIAEELLNALAQFPDLRVAARTSAFSFRGDDVDLREVGNALGVAHVLEGSVRQSGDRLRITAQLIRTSDGYHLWSETYERTMTDVFEIQDDIVSEISRILQIRLGVGSGAGRAMMDNINPQAYEQYLRGLALWSDREDRSNRQDAFRSFQRAADYDPNFADAWAALGMSIIRSSGNSLSGLSRTEENLLALEAVEAALTLAPDNARALAGSAAFHISRRMDIERATAHARRAVEIAPNAAFAHYALATVLALRGDIAELERVADRAMTLDPLNQTIHRVLSERLASYGRGPYTVGTSESCSTYSSLSTCLAGRATAATAAGDMSLASLILTELAQAEAVEGPAAWAVEDGFPGATEYFSAEVALYLGAESEYLATLEHLVLESTDIDLWRVSLLAEFGHTDLAARLLIDVHEAGLGNNLNTFLSGDAYEFPETLRRNPRYHEFWALPGMPELEAIRRSNDQNGGLPLPIEGGE
jgi:TolB-like protein